MTHHSLDPLTPAQLLAAAKIIKASKAGSAEKNEAIRVLWQLAHDIEMGAIIKLTKAQMAKDAP